MSKPITIRKRQAGGFLLASLAAFGILLLGTSCVMGPKYHAPAKQAPDVYKESTTQFSDTEGWKVANPQDAMLRGKWWEIFQDPELNALEDQLNINNQTIKQYFENFMEARAMVRQVHSQYFPTLTTNPSFTRSRSSQGGQFSEYSLPFDVSWEPDLWGRVRNTVHAAQYAAQVSAADLENERLTEQATLAEYFFDLRGQDALQQLFNATAEADRKTLEMTKSLYETGIDDQIAVAEAQTTLDTAEAAAIGTGVARAQYEHAIAVLVGKQASTFSIPVKPLTATPPPIPIGLPSQLLERRPDIAAAERTMAEANAQIGIAHSAYFPTLTLSAAGGFQSPTASSWLSWPNRFWSIGPSLAETIFDAGLRRATVAQYVAAYNGDLANYRQTVLTAFQQVEDYLAAVRILSQEILKQQQAVNSAQTFLNLELGRYQTGIDPYINVLTAQTTLFSAQQTLATLQIQHMTAAVSLVEALGGGWDLSELPTPSQVTRKPPESETKVQQ